MILQCSRCNGEIQVRAISDAVLRGIRWRCRDSIQTAIRRAKGERLKSPPLYECVTCIRSVMVDEGYMNAD